MQDFLTEFHAAMSAAGFEPKGGKIVADDKWHQAAYMDERKYLSGAYTMKISGDFAIGCFFTRKDPDKKYKWHSKSKEKISPEQRKKIKRDIEEQQKRKDAYERSRQERISRRLNAAVSKLPTAKEHPYLTRKGVLPHGVKLREKGNEIIIPLRGADGKIWTIQRITEDGGKYLFLGGRKRASYYAICKSTEDLSLIILCEGFATGASIREATGLPVIVAIDSGNIKAVLSDLKIKYPKSRFIICADNDAYTLNAKKEPWNVGIEKAREAASSCGGAFVCWPEFGSLAARTNTDFNDLHKVAGLGEVAAQIKTFIDRIPAPPNAASGSPDAADTAAQDEAAAVDRTLLGSDQHHGGGDIPHAEPEERMYDAEAQPEDPMTGDYGMNYKVLGYNEGLYYYFPFKERQIVALTASAHSMPNLFRLDDLDGWMNKFGGTDTSEKKVVLYATNALMELAKRRGVFKEQDRVRGCGAWIDEGRKVLHCGDILYVDGAETKFDQLKSDHTYVAAAKLMRAHKMPLSNREANALRQICEAVTWENKLSGSLLAGWIVIAPICGALSFRPHVYITGEAESGKSTVLNKIIKAALGSASINIDGGTTEPAIRQMMGYDARPIVYDEAEKSPYMQAVIELARKSSTGAQVGKFGQKIIKARSCFCFSAINPPVNKTADESRISFMVIKKNRRSTAIEEYNALLEMIETAITPDFASRLLARTIQHMDTLLANIKIFEKAARRVVKGARASEVIGAMLGGLYLLSSTDLVTLEFAEEWIAKHDWSTHTSIEEDADPAKLLQHLSSCIMRYTSGGVTKDVSVGDLIILAKDGDNAADKLLRYSGIAVKDGRVHIASRSQNLEKMLRGTDWEMKWTRMLSNVEGAESFKIFYFGVGFKTSGVSLPINLFTDREEVELPQIEEYNNVQDIPF